MSELLTGIHYLRGMYRMPAAVQEHLRRCHRIPLGDLPISGCLLCALVLYWCDDHESELIKTHEVRQD